MRQTARERVVLETERPLSAAAAQEIKDAWMAWQVIARRHGVSLRVEADRRIELPDYSTKPYEVA